MTWPTLPSMQPALAARADRAAGEHAGQDRADHAADAVHAERVEASS